MGREKGEKEKRKGSRTREQRREAFPFSGSSCPDKPAGMEKCCQHSRKKDGDVCSHGLDAKGAGIGVVKHGNQQAAEKISLAECKTGIRAIGGKIPDGAGSKEQHGKKQQLDMFPDGFIYRRKHADKGIVSRPSIQKVRECSDYGSK